MQLRILRLVHVLDSMYVCVLVFFVSVHVNKIIANIYDFGLKLLLHPVIDCFS